MAQPSLSPVTYEDLLALPEHVVGEIIDGELIVSPRPRLGHAHATGRINLQLDAAFGFGSDGSGAWIILIEPELHLGADVLVPDLAAWRRSRVPADFLQQAYATVAPDWVCEVLSPGTAKLDRLRKLPLFAREQVGHVWFLDPRPRSLEVFRLDRDSYRCVLLAEGDQRVRAEPFDAIELALAPLWTP